MFCCVLACCSLSNEPEDSDPTSVEYYVGRCAHEVMCEYQRQLWDNVDFS